MADEQGGTSGGLNLGGFDLVTIGALVVLASWLIFDLISDDYPVGALAVALAGVVALLPRLDAGAITSIAPIPAFLKLAGYTLAVVGVVEIISDIENSIFDAGGATIFGALVAWAGYVIAFVGARQA
jgi:hypothetical protein